MPGATGEDATVNARDRAAEAVGSSSPPVGEETHPVSSHHHTMPAV
jgi:hypothetical protein